MRRQAPPANRPRRRAAAPWLLHGMWALAVVLLLTAGLGLGGALSFGDGRSSGEMPGDAARLPFRPSTPHAVEDPCPHGDFDEACQPPAPEAASPSSAVVTCLVVRASGAPLSGATCRFGFGDEVTLGQTGADGTASAVVPVYVTGELSASKDGFGAESRRFDVSGDIEVRLVLYPSPVPDEPWAPDPMPPPVPDPVPDEAPELPEDPSCDNGTADPYRTYGRGDPKIPDLSWMSLKSGFRFAVAWSTPEASEAWLWYQIDGGEWYATTEGFNRTAHLIVLEGIAAGQRICFMVRDGPEGDFLSDPHEAHFENAMAAWDDANGTYTVNLLVLANEGPDRVNLELGMTYFADKMRDMTDGYVQVGQIMVVYNNFHQRDTGRLIPCTGNCTPFYDVVFATDENPGAAGTAELDGITSAGAKIVMNQNAEAPGPGSGAPNAGVFSEVGSVLAHEVGHYAFGAQDLYPGGEIPVVGVFANSALPVPDCYVPATRVSVMSGSRLPRELDDEVNRCPPENEEWHNQFGEEYIPTWTLLRQRFPEIPDRTTAPLVGPAGPGSGYILSVFDMEEDASVG